MSARQLTVYLIHRLELLLADGFDDIALLGIVDVRRFRKLDSERCNQHGPFLPEKIRSRGKVVREDEVPQNCGALGVLSCLSGLGLR